MNWNQFATEKTTNEIAATGDRREMARHYAECFIGGAGDKPDTRRDALMIAREMADDGEADAALACAEAWCAVEGVDDIEDDGESSDGSTWWGPRED